MQNEQKKEVVNFDSALKRFAIKNLTPLAWISGGATALFLFLWIKCMFGWSSYKDEMMNARLQDYKDAAKEAARERTQQAIRQEIQPQMNEVRTGIDSMVQVLDSIKHKGI